MEVMHARCAGLDVHKEIVVACARTVEGRKVQTEPRSFPTTVKGLLELSSWLTRKGCTHVAMEATGVYWKPVWHVLEGAFELVLANAAHVKNVPGRKTDVKDAEWIAELLAHGLVRASFVPPQPIQELRDLTRTRKQLVREVTQHTQRIQKTLENANIKLDCVISDILGLTGRRILEALIEGARAPEELAELKHASIRATRDELIDALRNTVTAHHRFMLRLHLQQIDALNKGIAELDRQLGDALDPFRHKIELLDTIPGVNTITAQVLLAEIGDDMNRFPTPAHLVSWASFCPGSDESAGKRRSTRIRKGGRWLKATLVQSAWGAVRTKDSYLRTQYYRLRARRGPKKAIVAVAASMLTAAYFILRDGVPYRDLGPAHFDRLRSTKTVQRLLKRLSDLGYSVKVEPAAVTAVSF
jgi:transposase